MAKLMHIDGNDGGSTYVFWCPGCKENHCYDVGGAGTRERYNRTSKNFVIEKAPKWQFNGNMDKPTFTPSLLYVDRNCHLFVRDGRIQFLSDCKHKLVGQTVDMVNCEHLEN